MDNTKAEPMREAKHISIIERIDRLENAVENLESLLGDVTGQKQPPSEIATQGHDSSLSGFLSDTPGRIEAISGRVHDSVNALRDHIL